MVGRGKKSDRLVRKPPEDRKTQPYTRPESKAQALNMFRAWSGVNITFNFQKYLPNL